MTTKKATQFKNWYEKWGRAYYQKKRSTAKGRADLERNSANFKKTLKGWAYQLHCNARHNSKLKNRPAPTITREWIAEELEKGCCVTGHPFVFDGPPRHPYAPSLDRIDNSRPYAPDNVRAVLYAVNMGIGTWGLEEYLRISKAAMAFKEAMPKQSLTLEE